MFKKEDFELLSKHAGNIYDNNNNNDIETYQKLMKIYSNTSAWAEKVKQTKHSWKIIKRESPIDQANPRKFTNYHWARLHPNDNRDLAFVVSIDIKGFEVRIDLFGNRGQVREKYERIRDHTGSHIVSRLSIADGCNKSIDDLADWALTEFNIFHPTYDYIFSELFPVNQNDDNQIQRDQVDNEPVPSLNQILYGPPGTGKTYNTINNAVKIINPQLYDEISKSEKPEEQKRKELKKEFNGLLNAGQIAFTTFHQSFGYEDFVEGLKVTTSDDGSLDYVIQPGIFKQICNTATVSSNDSLQQLNVSIEKLKEQLIEEPIRLKTDAHKKEFTLTYNGKSAFYAKPDAGKYNNPVSIDSIKKLYMNPEIKSGSNGVHFKVYALPVIQYLIQHYKIPKYQEPQNKLGERHVLIINEINRGNISKIFGELITLIESDKRADEDEELTVTLPYSKEAFSVPRNVHIIGTMNTADASLAKLDIALRRRFDFIEKPPEPEILKNTEVAGVNLSKMLTVINKRIEVLYDRDHTIGHSFFMKLTNDSALSDLEDVFRKNIIPLLQEYFFEDWERIHWVLDCLKDEKHADETHFVKKKYSDGDLKYLMGSKWSEKNKENYESVVWELNDKVFKKAESYISVYSEDNQPANE